MLKETQKKLTYFARDIYKDKCIKFMIALCILAIIIIIILAMTGNDNGRFTGVPKDMITEKTGWKQGDGGWEQFDIRNYNNNRSLTED